MNNIILAIDIGTTHILSVVTSNDVTNDKINILGVSKVKSDGVLKGNIVDINLAGHCIKNSVAKAIHNSEYNINKAIVSLSGANTKTLRSHGSVNIPMGQITHNEIRQVLKMALYNANISTEYEMIHVLPILFRVDDGAAISNPLNMNGSRFEVLVNVIIAKKSAVTNIQNALKIADLDVDRFVLAGYANAISTLRDDEKRLGSIIINLGGTSSQLVAYKESTITYTDFVPIGSEHITNDISVMLHTPYSAANMVKKQYGTLLAINENEQDIKKVKLPLLGNEEETKEISLDQIQPILHARVEETLVLLQDRLVESSVRDTIDGGIVLTGGMTLIPGIEELASKVFAPLTVKLANPINIQNGYINFDNPTLSTIVGLLMYELNDNDNFELDSNNQLKSKIYNQMEEYNNRSTFDNHKSDHNISNIGSIQKQQEEIKDNKPKVMDKFFKKLQNWI